MRLDESLGYLIAKTHKALKKKFNVILKDFDLREKQYAVLKHLYEQDGLSVAELVKSLFSDSSTVVDIGDRLEQKSLVKRINNQSDRRVKDIYLKDKVKKMKSSLLKRKEALNRSKLSILLP